MTRRTIGTLPSINPAWRRSLLADNRAEGTIHTYLLATQQLHDYCQKNGFPTDVTQITTDSIRGYLGWMLQRRSSSTAAQRYRSLQQGFKWLCAEGLIEQNPMARVNPPKIIEVQVPVLTVDQIKGLMAECHGKDFDDLRDEAIFRLFLDSGLRLSELANIKLTELDMNGQQVTVLGKGRKTRTVPFSAKTGQSIDRYLRQRRDHRDGLGPWLWVGSKPPRLSDSGIAQLIARRSLRALSMRVHPHQLRHTWAHNYLSAGGQEGDLQRLAGWASAQMVMRYGASAGMERAHSASRRLGLGNNW